MTTSLPPLSLKAGLKIWGKEEGTSVSTQGEHLSGTEFLRFTRPGGMETAPSERKEHLSNCSLCLQRWFEISEEQGFVEDLSEDLSSDDWYSGGMMEAAAGELSSSLTLRSRCGEFQLSLYPDEKKKGEGMITLEYVGSSDRGIEGRWVTVKDIKGFVLLDGAIRVGRIATISRDFNIMDLQAWSVQVHAGGNDGVLNDRQD